MAGPEQSHPCSRCGASFPSEALFCPMCGLPQPRARGAAGTDPLAGQIVGERYLLQARIGEGASGIIYRGEHVTLRRPVAVKLLHHKLSTDDLAIERFRRRFQAIEKKVAERGGTMKETPLAELDRLWDEAKKTES